MVLSGVCWWGCCLGLFPAMGKQCFAISALQRTFLPISMIQVSIIPSPASLQCFSHCYTCTLLDISEICITLPPPWFQTSPIYSLLLFLQPFLVPSLKSDLCFPLETSSAPSCRLHFSFPVALLSVFYLFPDSQYLDSSPCLQESLRSGQAGSWRKGSNMQAQDTGQGSSLPMRCIRILNSPSQVSTASLLPASAPFPPGTSAMKIQLSSVSPVHPFCCGVTQSDRNLSQ